MNPNRIHEISDEHICDRCGLWTQNQVETLEGDWVCPTCEEKISCFNCGDITDECKIYDGHMMCPECIHLEMLENPPSFMEVYSAYILNQPI